MATKVTMVTEDSSEDRAYSIEDAAALWSISAWTVRKWIAAKKITSCKLDARRVIPKSEISRVIADSLEERKTRPGRDLAKYELLKMDV